MAVPDALCTYPKAVINIEEFDGDKSKYPAWRKSIISLITATWREASYLRSHQGTAQTDYVFTTLVVYNIIGPILDTGLWNVVATRRQIALIMQKLLVAQKCGSKG
ncbi:5181_t:CDS:1 [Ambispora gerdemannii]|uniref:5181_t:CDS:1 n=1 Tax=Ambispora gerdemannii TaxID=144530 RepID=A0A9N8WSG3_9GLOM|nr:5181_t:CDS:1 [Ambispora gerdemannii]